MISQKTRASLTVIISSIIVLFGTVLLVAVASGYNIDIFNGEISTRGLVKLNTNPAGATIKLNSKIIKQKTPYQLDSVKIGPITIEYEKEGYHKWSSKFLVEGGVVTFADYALLIPNEIETKNIDATLVFNDFLSNPDHSKLYVVSENTGLIHEVQRNSQIKKIAELPQNASFKPAAKLTEGITNEEGSAIVTKAIYPDSKPVRFWVGVSNGAAVNIDEIIGEETRNIIINPKNNKEIFGINNGQLIKSNVDSRLTTKLGPANINSLAIDKSFIYTLENLTPQSNGQFLVRYDFNGGGRYVMEQYPASTAAWQIVLSKLNNTEYLAITNPADGSTYVISNDGQKILSSFIGTDIKYASFNQTGRFLSYFQANNFKCIDLEYTERFYVKNEGIGSIAWFTDYQLVINKADGPYIVDYSGDNLVKLPPNINNNGSFKLNFTSDNKTIYFINAGKISYYSLQPKSSLINF